MIIYGIKNCDTMKKAFAWLEENGVAYTFHDYKTKGITPDKLKAWLKHTTLDKLVNTKGTTFKQLSDTDKIAILNPKSALELIAQKTSVIKRPIVETGNSLLIGFDAEYWETHV